MSTGEDMHLQDVRVDVWDGSQESVLPFCSEFQVGKSAPRIAEPSHLSQGTFYITAIESLCLEVIFSTSNSRPKVCTVSSAGLS